MLSPHGHVEQHWQVTELGGRSGSTSSRARPPRCSTTCRRCASSSGSSRPTSRADWAVLSLVGPGDADVLAAAGLPVPARSAGRSRWPAAASSGAWRWPGADAFDLLVPRAERRGSRRRAASAPARRRPALWAFEALRVEARRPRLRFETDHRTIPHEVGWIGIGRPPEQGLLPRPGDGRPRAEPRQAAAPARAAAPRRRVGRAAASRARRSSSTGARSASSAPRCTTTSSARSRWRSSSGRCPTTPS